MRELQSFLRESFHIRRADFRGAVSLRIELTVIIRDENDDVGLSSQCGEQRAKSEEEQKAFHDRRGL
jgi:hypothetical protein